MEPSENSLTDWQKNLFDGFKPGEMMIISAGRNTGKSQMSQYLNQWESIFMPPFRKTTSAVVDGETWHTVRCDTQVGKWIRTQDPKFWHEHIDQNWMVYKNTFDIHEKIYTMLGVKFT